MKMSMRIVFASAVICGLFIGIAAGFVQNRWPGDEDSAVSGQPIQFPTPTGFPAGNNLDPGDFIDLAEAEGGAAALESFISSGFGVGGPDPDFLRERLTGFGMQIPEGATTKEMLEMLAAEAEAFFPAPVE